jgi:uncharacterized protein (DUF305 family)
MPPTLEGTDQAALASPTSQPTPAGSFNDPDVAFALMMVPHHEQAVRMAALLLDKEGISPEVAQVAEAIKAAQAPELDTLNSWIDAWGYRDAVAGMEGMDHGGMASDAAMAALAAATGTDASRLFLEAMIEHHRGAVDMAEQEISDGENADAVALANTIVTGQTAEVAAMQVLLNAL